MKNKKSELESLKKELEHHNYLYYVLEKPEISDQDYDNLLKKANDLANELGEKEIHFGSDLSGKFSKIKHNKPMLSLSNSYSFEELEAFDERVRKVSTANYVAEAKLDGFSISLIYQNHLLKKGVTRGDGTFGEDVTENVLEIDNIPKKIDIPNLEVRGEIVMPITAFNKLNSIRAKEGLTLFANPRNAASGSIRQLDKNIIKDRGLKCFAYYIDEPCSQKVALNKLKNLGFEVVEHYEDCKDISAVKEFIKKFEVQRVSLDYQTDGVVIKLDSYKDQLELGYTNKSPRWAIAYKYPPMQVVTRINHVTFQIGRSGKITPVAELEPVQLSGSIISRATLHNFHEIKNKDIRIKDYVFIEKGGDVIPKIVKPIESKRDGSEKMVVTPTSCPFCNSLLVENGINIFCMNSECATKLKKELEFFVSKECMSIEGFGSSTIDKLFEAKKIKYPQNIYFLNEESFIDIEGFQKKSINKLLDNIEKSKNNSYSQVILSLGIPHVGRYSAKILSNISIDQLINESEERLSNINGIGDVVAKSIVDFFKNQQNLDKINTLKQVGVNFQNNLESKKLEGKTFLITGTLRQSRDQIEREILKNGGTLLSSVSKNLNYLLLGDNPGQKLSKTEKYITQGVDIKIISEALLVEMLS